MSESQQIGLVIIVLLLISGVCFAGVEIILYRHKKRVQALQQRLDALNHPQTCPHRWKRLTELARQCELCFRVEFNENLEAPEGFRNYVREAAAGKRNWPENELMKPDRGSLLNQKL